MGNASITACNVSKGRVEDFLEAAEACANRHNLDKIYPNHNAIVTSQIWQQVASVDLESLALSKQITGGMMQNNAPAAPVFAGVQNSGKGTSRA